MLHLDPTTLAAVVNSAKLAAANEPRWQTAIARAAVELQDNPYVEALDDHTLLIGSPSGQTYTANGSCQCKAFEHGIACWHRAAARLYRRYTEAQARTGSVWSGRQIDRATAQAEMDEVMGY